jgi:dCTP deaminase
MTEPQGSELFRRPDAAEAERQRDSTTGLLPSQLLREAVAQGREILSPQLIGDDQIQPASIDLRLGEVAYRVRASFLPGARASVRDKLDLLSMHLIDLTQGAVLEKDCVYIVPLLEYVSLRKRTAAAANPKSSTGRLDVFARVITDYGTEFDRVREGYKGPLFAEISPRAFSILVRTGSRRVQLRIRRGSPGQDAALLRRAAVKGRRKGSSRSEGRYGLLGLPLRRAYPQRKLTHAEIARRFDSESTGLRQRKRPQPRETGPCGKSGYSIFCATEEWLIPAKNADGSWAKLCVSNRLRIGRTPPLMSRATSNFGIGHMRNSTSSRPELFPPPELPSPPPVTDYPKAAGIIPSQGLAELIGSGEIASLSGIALDQIQPASIDLRLGARAYRVQASFLPGGESTVMDRVARLDGLPPIDLSNAAVLERGAVYVIEISESLRLTNGIQGVANPKSSTGRLDVLTRLITDRATAFDRVEKGYKGSLYVEVAPLSFSVVVRQGTRLNQLRLYRGNPELAATEVARLYAEGQLARAPWGVPLPLRGNYVPVSVDLGIDEDTKIGFRAKKNSKKIDMDLVNAYDPTEFWEPIHSASGTLNLDKGDFYILVTREEIGVPPHLAAEMVPYDPGSGEFRVHYAGFYDPGFGWNGRAGGSRAVLEVRSYGVSFTLEHGQIVGWLNYGSVGTARPDKIYGSDINSHYQGQGLALSKHFQPWPTPG